MTKTAVLYARVSNRSQDERGLSIPAQFGELRAWAAREDVRVVGEVADTGGKGSKRDDLERPGLDSVYDLCERHRPDMVVAQSWDRLGERDVPTWIGRRLAATSGTKLRTPDDPNEEDDEGAELLRLVGRWNAGRERKQTARRSRSRKLELARSGFVVPNHTPTYGFLYAGEYGARLYRVHEQRMGVVRRVFREVASGTGIRTLARALDADGVPPPAAAEQGEGPLGRTRVERQFLRDVVLKDAYRPHTDEQLDALVASGHLRPEVRSRAEAGCGVWWYRGGDYEGNRHAVAVPVPGAGVPRETVDEARRRLAANRPSASAGDRFWPLSGGLLRCWGCGLAVQTHTVKNSKRTGNVYRYYRCPCHQHTRKGTCPAPVNVPAEKAEEAVWGLVCALEASPERVLLLIEEAIDRERARLRRDPTEELREVGQLADALAARRANYQDQAAAGLTTLGELRARLDDIEERREALARRADELRGGGEYLADLSRLMEHYRDNHPDHAARRVALAMRDAGGPDIREKLLELGAEITAVARDQLEVSGVFGTDTLYIGASLSSPRSTPTTPPQPSRG